VGVCAALLSAALLLSSCHRTPPPTAKRYSLTGRVVSIDLQNHSAVIDGDAVPGFMDAMAMPYQVKPPEALKQLSVGDSISAEIVDTQQESANGEPSSWIENIKVTAHAKSPPPGPGAALRTPAPGDDVPDFALTNQSGRRISLRQYRGKFLLVTFIYTRCPFPDFCPRVSGNFAEIDKQLAVNPALAGAHLLSISFDPEHDTPKILRDYGFSVARTHDPALFNRWEFAVAAAADLPRIADFFALTVKPEGGLITHNLSTAVIGPNGKIVNWYHGSDWQASDLIKDVTPGPVAKAPAS
jgi:protein SCO1/2